jgi:hypothetical protein
MKATFSFLFVLLVLFSCDKEKSFKLDGPYSGTFYRTRDGAKVLNSDVTLTVESNKFSGTSSNNNSPAICSGTFSTTEKEIDFLNGCMFTADFDGTLILNGKFKISEKAGEIVLSKEIDAQNGDFYVLKKGTTPL